jgi:hypothetical protein
VGRGGDQAKSSPRSGVIKSDIQTLRPLLGTSPAARLRELEPGRPTATIELLERASAAGLLYRRVVLELLAAHESLDPRHRVER